MSKTPYFIALSFCLTLVAIVITPKNVIEMAVMFFMIKILPYIFLLIAMALAIITGSARANKEELNMFNSLSTIFMSSTIGLVMIIGFGNATI